MLPHTCTAHDHFGSKETNDAPGGNCETPNGRIPARTSTIFRNESATVLPIRSLVIPHVTMRLLSALTATSLTPAECAGWLRFTTARRFFTLGSLRHSSPAKPPQTIDPLGACPAITDVPSRQLGPSTSATAVITPVRTSIAVICVATLPTKAVVPCWADPGLCAYDDGVPPESCTAQHVRGSFKGSFNPRSWLHRFTAPVEWHATRVDDTETIPPPPGETNGAMSSTDGSPVVDPSGAVAVGCAQHAAWRSNDGA